MASYRPSHGPSLRTHHSRQTGQASSLLSPENVQASAGLSSRDTGAAHQRSSLSGRYGTPSPYGLHYEDGQAPASGLQSPRNETVEEIERWRERRAEQLREENSVKRKDLEDLQRYQPWGRPGGGAPNVSDQLLTRDGEVSTKMQMANALGLEGDFDSGADNAIEHMSLPFSRTGGGGAVQRTQSGRLLTKRHGDPETRFQPSFRNHVQNELRYTASHGQDGDVCVNNDMADHGPGVSTSPRSPPSKMAFFPFGRPGCGAPLRDEKGHLKTSIAGAQQPTEEIEAKLVRRQQAFRYREHLANQLEEKKQTNEVKRIAESRGQEQTYSPWGKGYGSVSVDSAGFTRCGRRRLHRPVIDAPAGDEVDCVADRMGRPGAGAPLAKGNGVMQTKLRSTVAAGGIIVDAPQKSGKSAFPWLQTSPRRGAAKRAQQLEFIHEEDHPTTEQRQQYLSSLKEAAEKDRSQRQVAQRLDKEVSPASTADWISKLQVGRPHRHPVTGEVVSPRSKADDIFAQSKVGDVISVKPTRYAMLEQRDLHDDLTKQANVRHQQRLEERRAERDQSRQHVETFNTLWGRPGAGAPLRDKHGKVRAGRNYTQLGEDSHKTEGVR